MHTIKAISIAEVQALAKKRLPKVIYDYLVGGAEDEETLNRNTEIFSHYGLRPRLLQGNFPADTSIEVFGQRLAVPYIVAPTGLNGIFYHDGDLALAEACADANTIFSVSTAANHTLERIATCTPGTKWFQLYPWGDAKLVSRLVERAEIAGYKALIITVDSLVPGKRERDLRNQFAHQVKLTPRIILDGLLHPHWLASVWLRGGMPRVENLSEFLGPTATAKQLADFTRAQRNPNFSWKEVRSIRQRWKGPMLIKGVLTPEDAKQALEEGIEGIVVSNHGGRQLDGTYSTIEALQDIRASLGASPTVIVDGGFRRGSHILKALALGATAVMLGRAPLFGLAAAGKIGAARVFEILNDEISRTMNLMGVRSIRDVGANHIRVLNKHY
ncbi:alpha-hydroxy acid oxidase [uncultured Pigmentiphaga sp.]|uniref:alpha-hydroxy acid oxidase n=1 Tax=uncultured Pigmentiphaga sp. TaxID=340361 RepID=UPI002611ACB6|nr:alpha-hydroxy acid oxidase [uncultured Pigmentiphaga sp.]